MTAIPILTCLNWSSLCPTTTAFKTPSNNHTPAGYSNSGKQPPANSIHGSNSKPTPATRSAATGGGTANGGSRSMPKRTGSSVGLKGHHANGAASAALASQLGGGMGTRSISVGTLNQPLVSVCAKRRNVGNPDWTSRILACECDGV